MHGLGIDVDEIKKRIRFCDYLSVAQIYLRDNFFLDRPLEPQDIKPRLLGHWGTCPGINVAYANLKAWHQAAPIKQNFEFVLGPGHGFPALQANLLYDDELVQYYPNATHDLHGIEYVCAQFSWPYGFPSHSYPGTPGAIIEGGELGYCLAAAYGASLNKPENFIAVLIGDGELETGTALASLNLHKLINSPSHGRILPILHLNGYKISAPTIYGRKSERELLNLFRGFGYDPVIINGEDTETFQLTLQELNPNTFLIMKTAKGATGPTEINGEKIADNYLSHQVPLPNAKTDPEQLHMLEDWLRSYKFKELYDEFAR